VERTKGESAGRDVTEPAAVKFTTYELQKGGGGVNEGLEAKNTEFSRREKVRQRRGKGEFLGVTILHGESVQEKKREKGRREADWPPFKSLKQVGRSPPLGSAGKERKRRRSKVGMDGKEKRQGGGGGRGIGERAGRGREEVSWGGMRREIKGQS